MIKKYYDQDCNLGVLDGKTVAIIGFGSQGHAHAMNLNESGVNVVVGLRPGSAHEKKALDAGLKVMGIEEAAEAGDIVMILTPDELQAKIYKEQIEKKGTLTKPIKYEEGMTLIEGAYYRDGLKIYKVVNGELVKQSVFDGLTS